MKRGSVFAAVYVVSILAVAARSAFAAAPVEPERRNAVVRAVEKAGPAVVNVSTERIVRREIDPFFEFRDKFFDETFRDFFGRQPQTFVQNSLGSGVIISEDGYVLTNAHVVMRSTKTRVTFRDKKQLDAHLINVDVQHDLALLKVESKEPLPVVPLGTSSDLMIGETTIAIGNPFGLENTVTTGVVSATSRSIKAGDREIFKGLLQTDAAINPGNSGGALLNIKGELIGINTAIQSGAENIGFAIPVDDALASACALLDPKALKRIRVGIDTKASADGLTVANVEPKSPADEAGLKPGDVIVGLAGKAVAGEFAFRRILIEHNPGETVTFGVRRGNAAAEIKVKLGLLPEPSPREVAMKKLGLDAQDLTKELADAIGLRDEAGVLITDLEANGPAANAGLKRSDALVYVGRTRLKSVRDLGLLLKDLEPGSQVPVIMVRNRTLYRVVLTTR